MSGRHRLTTANLDKHPEKPKHSNQINKKAERMRNNSSQLDVCFLPLNVLDPLLN